MSLDFKAFKFWCQTVLPTVYDDSLSYYELLSKVVSKLNGVIEETSTAFNELEEQFNNLLEDVNKFTSELEFEKYVDSYFNELVGDRDIEKLIADFLSSNYNTNFLEVADVEIFAQNKSHDGAIRSSQGMDIGVIGDTPYIATYLFSEDANISNQFDIHNMTTGELAYTANVNLGHVNDICFCSKDNLFYIPEGDSLHRFNVIDKTFNLILNPLKEITSIYGIAYNSIDDVFYLYCNKKDAGRVLCKVNYEFNRILSVVPYTEPNYTSLKDQGIYFDGTYLYKINSRTTRDSEYSVFNKIDVYTSDIVYIKTINAPFAYELEALSFYDGKYYLSYNCYSRCGLIFRGNLFTSKDSYHTRDSLLTRVGVERWATDYTVYVGNNDTAKFFCNNTPEYPFCHIWAGVGYLTDINKTYATIELVSDVYCEFVCYGQTFTNIKIVGNGFKWYGYIRIENVNYLDITDLTIVADNEWCLFLDGVTSVVLSSVSYDTTGGDTAINCYDSNITFNGEYWNTATDTFINSNRMVNLRFNSFTKSGATTFGCSTYVMLDHNITARATSGTSLYDITLNSNDNINDIWRNGIFIVQGGNAPIGAYADRNAVIIADNIGNSSTKLQWFDRSRKNTQRDVAVSYKIIDHDTNFDSGWIEIKEGYQLLSEYNKTYYVDSVSGDDLNDGSKSKPFKSFNRFLEEYKYYSELRCHFIGDGDYYENTRYETINSCGMHIVNESNNANVTIKWLGKNTPCFYNSHLNIAGDATKHITLDIPKGLYFDGGMYTMKYTKIRGYMTTNSGSGLSMNGGYGIHEYCEFISCRLRASGAILTLTHSTFNGDMTACVSAIQGSTIRIASSFICNANVGSSGVLYALHSTLYLGCAPTFSNNQMGMTLGGAITFAKTENFNQWNVNGSKFTFSPLLSETYQFLNN